MSDFNWGGWLIGLVILAAVGLVIWACVADGNEMAAKEVAFKSACTADGRKAYDCNLQWDTYREAHDAKLQAAAATGMAAGAAAGRK